MKTLLILGAGKEQVAAIAAAKAKGIRTVVLDFNPQADGRALADEFHLVSTRDRDAVLNFVTGYISRIDGVMTIASDIPHMVSAAAEKLGVRHIPLPVAELCVNKLHMKEKLREAGVNVPLFARIASLKDLEDFIAKAGFPIVIKPVDNSGARGVQRLTQGMDIAQAFDYSRGFAYSGEVIAEKFVTGLQISTEGLIHDGVFYCTGFADRNYARLDDAVPFMVEDGGDIPTVLNAAQKKLVEAEFEKASRALGIDWGPAKGDMIFGEDGKPYVIEIAARLSGGNFCYDKVPWSTGVDIVDILVDMAVGNDVDPARFTPTRDFATSQRYFFPASGTIRKIDGLNAVQAMAHIRKVDVWARPGETVAALENHPSRVGYVISCAPTRKEAVAAAQAAVAQVAFTVEA
ncbi:MAG TPA: ATP-grasp domain-containing protein [Rhizomicrobium sp.]|nr:ATP-grasp domain-containing protein [Rhizomicrobium sp.]